MLETKDLTLDLDNVSLDKLKKLKDVVSDRLIELKQELNETEQHLEYINALINKKS